MSAVPSLTSLPPVPSQPAGPSGRPADLSREQDIFRRGSTTYYFSSLFFPEPVRSDVFRLYSFVRVADDYVDEQPAQPERLQSLKQRWVAGWPDASFPTTVVQTDDIDSQVLKNMVYVARTYDVNPAWVDDFLTAMQADVSPEPYRALDDTLAYVHGSAEVIGLMMARILGLPAAAARAAQLQGRAMQFINFIRDIAEDNGLGRCYFPSEELEAFGLADLSEQTARRQPEAFCAFIRFQIKRYEAWQLEAAAGYRYIPKRYRIPIRTAADMYNWTARHIYADPMLVFRCKLKPGKIRVMCCVLKRAVYG